MCSRGVRDNTFQIVCLRERKWRQTIPNSSQSICLICFIFTRFCLYSKCRKIKNSAWKNYYLCFLGFGNWQNFISLAHSRPPPTLHAWKGTNVQGQRKEAWIFRIKVSLLQPTQKFPLLQVHSERDITVEFGKLYTLRGGKKHKDVPGVLAIILGVGLIQMDQLLKQVPLENSSLKRNLEQLKNSHHVLQAAKEPNGGTKRDFGSIKG